MQLARVKLVTGGYARCMPCRRLAQDLCTRSVFTARLEPLVAPSAEWVLCSSKLADAKP